MNHESLLKLIGELTAQRDDYVSWQGEAMRRIGKLVEGQPEIKPGLGVLTVLEQYVGRLVEEKATLETALEAHLTAKGYRDALASLNGDLKPIEAADVVHFPAEAAP